MKITRAAIADLFEEIQNYMYATAPGGPGRFGPRAGQIWADINSVLEAIDLEEHAENGGTSHDAERNVAQGPDSGIVSICRGTE